MPIKIYQVDAFGTQLFSGNPAAVCPLDHWLDDELLQNIAMENNLAETAFYVTRDDYFELRWFTPTVEVDLCGHATLAAAHVLFQHENYQQAQVQFKTRSGMLSVEQQGAHYTLNFPADILTPVDPPTALLQALQLTPLATFRGRDDYLAIVDQQKTIEQLRVDLQQVAQLNSRGLIVSARGEQVDFVSRCFFPQSGVDEDPVTGSAHTTLTPYWADILQKKQLQAQQLSSRKGVLECELMDDRVLLKGQAHTYLIGQLFL
ncbi:MAG: PhzF family phenazine biosynthesis protein [Bacteroidota bacterium]